VARIGGDEFLVLLDTERRQEHDELTPEQLLNPVTGRISEETAHALGLPANADLQGVGFNIAVGGTVWQQGMSVADMRNASEQNMYSAKKVQHAANGGAYRS
jgi:GGDEF domain-containing protein